MEIRSAFFLSDFWKPRSCEEIPVYNFTYISGPTELHEPACTCLTAVLKLCILVVCGNFSHVIFFFFERTVIIKKPMLLYTKCVLLSKAIFLPFKIVTSDQTHEV